MTTPESQERETEQLPINLDWYLGHNETRRSEGIRLSSDPTQICAHIVYQEPLPQIADADKAALSMHINEDGKIIYFCGFGEFSLREASKTGPNAKPSLTHHRQTKRLDNELPNPIRMEVADVTEILRNRTALFYTGAGISVAAGVPDMKRLKDFLGIDKDVDVDDFARDIMHNPEKVKRKLVELSAIFLEKETEAHRALAEIQNLIGLRVATENLDELGDAAGIHEIKRHQIDNELTDEELKKIEFIITAGLSVDDSGLLYRYKQVNPEGKIIALNIEPPHYLSEEDYYVEGDIQETLPKIRELLSN